MTVMIVNGRLGRDAELKFIQSGTAVAELAIAYNYGRKGDDGNRPTQWVRASLWGKQAESLTPYLTKGAGVVVTLEDVHVRSYQKSDGTAGSSLEGRVIKFDFAAGAGGAQSQNQAPQNQQPRAQAPQQNYQAANYDGGGMGDMEGDIPFAPLFARNAYCV